MLTVSGNSKQTDAEPMWLRMSIRCFSNLVSSEQRETGWLIFLYEDYTSLHVTIAVGP